MTFIYLKVYLVKKKYFNWLKIKEGNIEKT